ncbi:hypothetical protein AOLI_G00299250 [Acnodon oligacanthus]
MQQAFSKPVSGARRTGLWGASRQGKARKYYTASSFPPPPRLRGISPTTTDLQQLEEKGSTDSIAEPVKN